MGIAVADRKFDGGYDLPERRLWTREEFERASESGLFAAGERLELIEGEIIRKVAPMKAPHYSTLLIAQEVLRAVFSTGYVVAVQMPLILGKRSEPEPDLMVLPGTGHDYNSQRPTTTPLVVEISDTTLRLDRTVKAGLYARAGIPEYWIINLVDNVLEVHREPGPMASQPLGHHYRSITRLTSSDSISPLSAPDADILVGSLLP